MFSNIIKDFFILKSIKKYKVSTKKQKSIIIIFFINIRKIEQITHFDCFKICKEKASALDSFRFFQNINFLKFSVVYNWKATTMKFLISYIRIYNGKASSLKYIFNILKFFFENI